MPVGDVGAVQDRRLVVTITEVVSQAEVVGNWGRLTDDDSVAKQYGPTEHTEVKKREHQLVRQEIPLDLDDRAHGSRFIPNVLAVLNGLDYNSPE